MKFRNTLLAVAVLGGLVAWIYFYEYRGEEGRLKAEEAAKKVVEFDKEKADGLDLIRPEGTVSLRREGGDWKLTAPTNARADGEEVSGLLSTLSWLEVDHRMQVRPEDLGEYKLGEPALRIVLHPGEGKPEVSLAVGDKSPIGSAYYARLGEAPEVITVSASVDKFLKTTAETLRYKKVVGLDSWNVSRFTVARGGSMLAFAKQGEDWRLESPVAFPAERTKVSNLLYDLTALRAEGFEPDGTALSSVGLASPEATLRLEEKDGRSVTVEFSSKDDSGLVRARRPDMPEIFRVKGDALDKLPVRADDYRDPRVAPVDRWELAEIRALTPAGEKVVLKDEQSNWRWGAIDGPVLDRKAVDDLLDALDAARASSYREGPEAAKKGIGTAAPTLTLRLKAREAAAAVEVRVGAEEGGRILIGSTASAAIYEVEKGLASKLVETASALKAPEAGGAAAAGGAQGSAAGTASQPAPGSGGSP